MKYIALAGFVAFAGAWTRGYPAVGPEVLMVIIPLVIWASEHQNRREQTARRYRERENRYNEERRIFLDEIRTKNRRSRIGRKAA